MKDDGIVLLNDFFLCYRLQRDTNKGKRPVNGATPSGKKMNFFPYAWNFPWLPGKGMYIILCYFAFSLETVKSILWLG
jgi:hypothetical protein